MLKAFTDMQLDPDNTVIVSGIGCSSSMPHDFKTYGIHGLHGRSLPIAEGLKLANNALTVLVAGGDGDGYGIGLQHFVHTARRNIDLTYIVMNNEIYGLTTGQASPTSSIGQKTKSTPNGVIERPINPISIAIAAGATFVARGFSGDPNFLAELIKKGMQHKGFSYIDVESPCVTFNKINTFNWARQVVYKLDEKYDPKDIKQAMEKALEYEQDPSKLATGIIYQAERKTYEEQDVAIKDQPLTTHKPLDIREVLALLDEHAV